MSVIVNQSLHFATKDDLIPYHSSDIRYMKIGGKVFVSNAPETVSDISRHVNKALYQDVMGDRFRFWSSHVNGTALNLKFQIYMKNESARTINIYRSTAYGSTIHNDVLIASNTSTRAFMDVLVPKDVIVATLAPGQCANFIYANSVAPGQTIVNISEWAAIHTDGTAAYVSVSNIVTTTDVVDPAPYAKLVAVTDRNSPYGGDYRGVFDHYARRGEINISLKAGETKWMHLSNSGGYSGEQENLYAIWDTNGNPVSRHIVTADGTEDGDYRQAYWYTEYQMIVNIASLAAVSTYYGSTINGSGGCTNHQYASATADYGSTATYYFAAKNATLISNEKSYNLRTLVGAGNFLPMGIFFRAT